MRRERLEREREREREGFGVERRGKRKLEMYEPVPQIHIIRLQPLQTPINSFAYILRLIRKHARAVRQALDTEFGREKDLIIHHPLSITTDIYTTLSLSLFPPTF